LADATSLLELPTYKGRPGWEFTDLGDFSLERWTPAPGDDGSYTGGRLLEPPAGAVELVQVDGGVGEGTVFDGGPVVLPLSVARERYPELVEPHLGSVWAPPTRSPRSTSATGRAARSCGCRRVYAWRRRSC